MGIVISNCYFEVWTFEGRLILLLYFGRWMSGQTVCQYVHDNGGWLEHMIVNWLLKEISRYRQTVRLAATYICAGRYLTKYNNVWQSSLEFHSCLIYVSQNPF